MTRLQHSARPRRESVAKRLGRKAKQIHARDGHRCVWCGANEGPLHLDHVVPRSCGGTDEPTNLIVACAACNCARHALTVKQWLGYLRVTYGWTLAQTRAAARRVRRHLATPLPE